MWPCSMARQPFESLKDLQNRGIIQASALQHHRNALLFPIFWCPEDYNACDSGMGCVLSDSEAVKQAGDMKSQVLRMGSLGSAENLHNACYPSSRSPSLGLGWGVAVI